MQFSHPSCKHVGVLRFDFAVLDDLGNVTQLIEFNGKQHYFYTPKFHKDLLGWTNSKVRDAIKIQWAKSRQIPLCVIRYDEIRSMKIILRKFLGVI